jgi:hypothetical protein
VDRIFGRPRFHHSYRDVPFLQHWFHHSYRVLNFRAPISILAGGAVARHIADVLGESPFGCVTILPAEGPLRHGDNEATPLKSLKAPAGCMRRYPQISRDLSHAVGDLAVVKGPCSVQIEGKYVARSLPLSDFQAGVFDM